LRALAHVTTPTTPLNVTGGETLLVRDLAHGFAERFGTEAVIVGAEAPTAWLNDSTESRRLFGPSDVTITDMLDWTAAWLLRGGRSLGKPTHFEARDGRY
jgi:hypothetical protein